MAQASGGWKASDDNQALATTIVKAVQASGELYRHGLGMIASENIVSPAVRDIVGSDLHGRYAEGLPGKAVLSGV